MPNLPVHWYEGMFLRPHHFQASDRYWHDVLRSHYLNDHVFNYGVSRVKIEKSSLNAGVLELVDLAVRFKDGTFVDIDRLRVDVNLRLKGLEADRNVIVYLAIPELRLGDANVTRLGSTKTRYLEVNGDYADESQGAGIQNLALLRTQAQIVFESEDLAGLQLLPLFKIRKDASQQGAWRVEDSYYPPALAINAWPDLQSIVRRIYDLIGERLTQLSRIVETRNISFNSQTPGDIEKLMLLHALNEAYAELSLAALTPGIHPYDVYAALVRTIGRCSIFGSARIVPRVMAYNHDELQPIFQWAWDRIRELIFLVQDEPLQVFPFEGSGLGMGVTLPAEYLSNDWVWFFGIQPFDLSPTELARSGMLQAWDWKLAAADDVERLFKEKAKGIDIRSPNKTEAGLPSALKDRRGWLLWAITEDAMWDRVRLTFRVAVRVSEKQIANLDSLNKSRRLLLSINFKTYGIEMALFAVRKRMG
jgi:type VI secretion system protein ImpJ